MPQGAGLLLPLLPGLLPHRAPHSTRSALRADVCMQQDQTNITQDWRTVRAKLVHQEKTNNDANHKFQNSYVYESPLIEQGSLLLGGTKQKFSFALRQQYFHKSVMLLLSHDESFTRGIILNRPSARELDGWRVWFGGDVAAGSVFQKPGELNHDPEREREIVCLHSLEGDAVKRLSMPIIRGVGYTTLEGAQALVASGDAKKSDFWLFVGYAGWGPGQLQGELERDSWFLAAADSATLLRELLNQGTALPSPSNTAEPVAGDGLLTWETLMQSIGRSQEVERTRGNFDDRMLREWVQQKLLPHAPSPARPVDEVSPLLLPKGDVAGFVLRSGSGSKMFTLDEQFIHKSILLIICTLEEDTCIATVLNRPTYNAVQFNILDKPRRCIMFGGDLRVHGEGLGVDGNGLLWLHRRPELGGFPIGDLKLDGVYRIAGDEATGLVHSGRAKLDDFLIVSGVVAWEREELEAHLEAGDLEIVREPSKLWHQVWSLADLSDGTINDGAPIDEVISDGTTIWWAAAQHGDLGSADSENSKIEAPPPSELADEALALWLRFFGGHGDPSSGKT